MTGDAQPSMEWTKIGEVPDATGGAGQPGNLGVAGAFAGVHNDALILAGGSNFPTTEAGDLWSPHTAKVFYDAIWVATRARDAAAEGGHNDSPGGARPLVWHKIRQTLPEKRAYGAAASHALGVIMIGGTDGQKATGDARLLRWDKDARQVQILALPPMPSASIDGGAAAIGDTLYVLVGNNGETETADLYAFDLSRIDLGRADGPGLAPRAARIIPKFDAQGRAVSPWRKLPPLPAVDGRSSARSNMMVAAQMSAEGAQLYVIGGRRRTTLEEFPDAAPVGIGEDRSYLHFYSDVWAYQPGPGQESGRWTRKADVGVSGNQGGRSAGAAVPVGARYILLLTSAKDDLLRKAFDELKTGWSDFPAHPGFERQALIYDTHKDRWTPGGDAPLVADPLDGESHKIAASAVTAQALCWGREIILASGELRPRVRTPDIWSIRLGGMAASGCAQPGQPD